MLELKDISKTFGDFPAVLDVNLKVAHGEFFALLGPSGCGKSTLLRILAGFANADSGSIILDGQAIDDVPAHQRKFNLVFQNFALFPHLTVWDNVAFGPRLSKLSRAEVKQRVSEALALVRMETFGSRSICTLSGGQQQRVALARAIVNRPRVLLLDEPLSALDLKLRKEMQRELLALQRRLGMTFIFVTHDQEEALALADRMAVMNQGRVEQIGTPSELYEHPASGFVADFIGSINRIDVECAPSESGGRLVRTAQNQHPLRVPTADLEKLGQIPTGTVMVRPEKMRLYRQKPQTAENQLAGIVRGVLFKGDHTEILVEADVSRKKADTGFNLVVKSSAGAKDAASKDWQQGDRCFIAWSIEHTLIFPNGSKSHDEGAVH